jgi:hypothetical protein
MTNSPLERMLAGVAAFLVANLPTYIARANSGIAGYQAPVPKKIEVRDLIPGEGPFPYGMVDVDMVAIDATGQNCQRITPTLSINFAFAESTPEKVGTACRRYMDALIDLFGENETLGGAAGLAYLESIDKAVLPQDGKGFVVATARLELETQT